MMRPELKEEMKQKMKAAYLECLALAEAEPDTDFEEFRETMFANLSGTLLMNIDVGFAHLDPQTRMRRMDACLQSFMIYSLQTFHGILHEKVGQA